MVNPVTVDVALVEEATTVLDVAVEDEDEGNDDGDEDEDEDEDEGDEDEGDEVPDPVVVDIAVVDVDNVVSVVDVDNVERVVDGGTVVVGRAVVDDVAGSVAVWATAVSEVNDSGTPIASATARAVEMRLCECAQRTIPPRGKQHYK